MESSEMMKMVSRFYWSGYGQFSRRGYGSPRWHRKCMIARSVKMVMLVCLILTLFLAMGRGYPYVFQGSVSQPTVIRYDEDEDGIVQRNDDDDGLIGIQKCDVFEGSWVRDASYPLYNSSGCPFAERGFDCLANGREDDEYLKWRWKPKSCEIPRFDVTRILESLRGKRIVLVGDSMSRTQWESLICLLMTGVEDKTSVYEINGNQITKQIRFLGVKFKSFNFTVEFFRSVYLVQHGLVPRRGPKRVRSTLKLDRLDPSSKDWIDSDVLIFNTGQWWSPGKLFETGCYFQVGRSLKLGMPVTTGFRTALATWASWVETMVDTSRTRIFFRTFEPSHWSDQRHRVCNVTQEPISETMGKDQSPFTDIISDVVKNMTVPVTILRVTLMGAFRSDAHVGTWSDTPLVVDCSHWCLPGVPDMWNEIVLSYLLADDGISPH